ncbi:PAMP-induced secreted peptide 1-like [Triticum urartu]|uniref:PAMP-induced secreted peptide 1-like n=1 Tax=Triticum urartu TaxID=4572 RepID=UPI0020445882|nr:PAMP-induced secreted peptide 1-like [Triticum urartu]
MASSSRRRAAILAAALVVVLLVARAGLVGAARPAPAGRSGDGAMYSAVYPAAVLVADTARETVEMLMARLPAGPSPKGPGH